MKRLENFEHWARAAHNEAAPRVDVTAAVLRKLTAESAATPAPAVWGLAGACACVAALFTAWGYDSWLSLMGDYLGWLSDFAHWNVL